MNVAAKTALALPPVKNCANITVGVTGPQGLHTGEILAVGITLSPIDFPHTAQHSAFRDPFGQLVHTVATFCGNCSFPREIGVARPQSMSAPCSRVLEPTMLQKPISFSFRLAIHFFLLTLAPVALADDPPPAASEGRPASDGLTELLQRGNWARQMGRWREAEQAYRAAWKISQRSDIAGELGACELALGSYRDAAEHLQIGLDHADVLSPERQQRFLDAQREAEREVAAVAIRVRPPDAELFVDGRSLGPPRPSYRVFLDPGSHTFRAALAGHEDQVTAFRADRGTSSGIELRLVQRKPATALTPAAPAPAGSEARFVSSLPHVGLAVTVAGFLLGSGLLASAMAAHEGVQERAASLGQGGCRRNEAVTACGELRALNETRDSLAIATSVTMAATFTVGSVTLAWFLWPSPEPREPREPTAARVRAGTARHPIGLALDGRW